MMGGITRHVTEGTQPHTKEDKRKRGGKHLHLNAESSLKRMVTYNLFFFCFVSPLHPPTLQHFLSSRSIKISRRHRRNSCVARHSTIQYSTAYTHTLHCGYSALTNTQQPRVVLLLPLTPYSLHP
uniref:Uncharacterized protein n=1 Tax=Trypanosoma congolense (strain IL3000) TaxID=1068625 RepID=G0UZE9_TRYCI|nr:hypothetical protein, unlikely [Trypanosoma congolense IL3000]